MQTIESRLESKIQPLRHGIERITKILSKEMPFARPVIMVDLDDTTLEPEKRLWTNGKHHRVFPETVAAFMAVNQARVNIGVVTEQAFTQLEPELSDVARLAFGDKAKTYDLFNGPVIGEGGSVVRRGSGERAGELAIMAPPQALRDRTRILRWMEENIKKENPTDNWGTLSGVDSEIGTLVQLPDKAQGIGTITLWERGPHITKDPRYINRYAVVKAIIDRALINFGITSLNTYEAGNGALRIVPKGIDKARTIGLLASIGAFSLGRTVFACDGPNDIKLANKIKVNGGAVIAVRNALPELHKIADYSSGKDSGHGFAEAVSQIFPIQYEQALVDLHERGLGLTQVK